MSASAGHRARWWAVVAGTGERLPCNPQMRGGDWGWDVTCSCGWDSRTGGAIQERVREALADHRLFARYEEMSSSDLTPAGSDGTVGSTTTASDLEDLP